ncbi:uncharacterized protein H6S33_012742 [Morchella sextelata]|uniref:uncharacterized protein n=1 Tax=Morchella sextelata TaxID=1174677 RepID=UPI001D03A8CB|nr:uncharacterized protein H6S33_012742 [Morchella sextelata]KAH0609256.1 hypothetical protein H6S33_012742 [Morchella sextelata]
MESSTGPPSLRQLAGITSSSSKPFRPSPLATATSIGAVHDRATKIVGPSDGHEGLKLSGRVISTACFLPYSLGYRRGGEWDLFPRRGSSALYDAIRNLSSDAAPWETTFVGWTGEIHELPPIKPARSNPTGGSKSSGQFPISASYAPQMTRTKSYHVPPPVPLIKHDGNRMTMTADYGTQEDEEIKIFKDDRDELEGLLSEKGKAAGWGDVVPVWIGGDEDGKMSIGGVDRWRNYAERVVWPLFHYIVPQDFSPHEGSALQERSWWRDYLEFNNAFADAIMKVYKPGDIVWIHDYHLLMLPEILRQRAGKDIYIGLFMHAPWPSSEIFKVLSRRKALLSGMLAANMLAFQSDTYKNHFTSCCKRLLGYTESYDARGNVTGVDTHGAHCAVEALPIGIDVEKLLNAAESASISAKMEIIKNAYIGRQIIVGRDRLDSVRGVVQKLRAFERFLDLYPEFIGRVVLIQVTSPSSLSQSSTIEHQVAELVSHINGKYGSLHFSPVQHYPQYLEPEEYYALLRVADLGLITSVRDGMNTTSLEYVVCQKDKHGPVILSEFTGTAESLTDAVIVNPTNTRGVADAIATCLSLTDEEKKHLHGKLYEYVTTNTVQTWNSQFLNKLLAELSYQSTHSMTPELNRRRFLEAYQAAGEGKGKRLFMFDYDGTLTPIVTDPEMAIPADKVVRSIKRLAQEEGNQVWIISGRDQKFLEEWLGHIGALGLSAEHGCFMRMPGSDTWENLAESMDMSWQKVAMEVFSRYTERTQGSFIERKSVAVTWHYRRADPEHGAFQARECMTELSNLMNELGHEVEVMTGKANLEVRPKFVNKGEIARKLVETSDVLPGFVWCVGDDTTDEDMFRALEGADLPKETVFTVTVGPASKETEANYHLLEPADVVEGISLLVGTTTLEEIEKASGEGKPSL